MADIINTIFSQLRYNNFEAKNILAYKIVFNNGDIADYSERPRTKHLLHLVTSGKRLYEIGDKTFYVTSGTLIFIPEGTKYKTTAYDFRQETCSGIGISFDTNGDFFNCKYDVYTVNFGEQFEKLLDLFRTVLLAQKNNPLDILEIKLKFYGLLSFLTEPTVVKSSEYAFLEPAINFINEHYRENLPIKCYSDACNLSESYFRKKFTDYFGKSPIDYRNCLRFTEAKLLYQNNFTTQEIAERLGFCDAGYMLKLYKQQIGRSLKEDSKII